MREEVVNDEKLVDELFEGDHVVVTPPTPARRVRKGLGKILMITGGALALFVILYFTDLLTSVGDVPRGITVAGIEVGGMTHSSAEAKLRKELEPRLTQPITIRAGDVDTRFDPVAAGLGLDWSGTLGRAGHQPLSPITRILSFFTTREVGVVTNTRPKQLTHAVTELAATRLNHDAVEGSIGFRDLPDDLSGTAGGVVAYPIQPRQGQALNDIGAAVASITAGWLNPEGVTLRPDITPVKATAAGVLGALDQIVNPAVAKPVVVHGDGKDAVLNPRGIARSFQFAARDDGALEVRVDQEKLRTAIQPDLADTQKEGKDAQIVFANDQPTVQPSEDARRINWATTFLPITDVLKKVDGRELTIAYDTTRPSVTTEAAGALGIKEVVGEFTTSGFSADVATNVRVLAGKVTGTIVKPGETFSLNTRSGPRSEAQGFVATPVNEDDSGPTVLGGGVSQFATTLYNAVYLAGLKDVDHAVHDYYSDRYPVGRDVKAMETSGTSVDLKFANDVRTGVAIQAETAGNSVTVRIWGTRHFRVESIAGSRANFTSSPVEVGSGACRPSSGAPGFTSSDTRVLYELSGGKEVRRETRAVTYGPKPTVICL